MTNNRNMGPVLIVLAGCFWGSMGLFVRNLTAAGFSAIQIAAIRITLAALFFAALQLVKDRAGFRISLRDLPLFLGLGIGSVLLFTVCYYTAMTMMSLSTAAILLYTSPIWIMLMSALFFKEAMNGRKILALVLAFGGCVLVSGVSGEAVTPVGLLFGLGAGFGYALYSILGTVALRRYSPYTVTTYTFLFAAVGSWLICDPKNMLQVFITAKNPSGLLLFCCLTALVTAVIPYLTYTLGLRTVEAGKAGILATVEPIVATLVGVFVFDEPLTAFAVIGIILVLAAVVVLNWRRDTVES